MNSPVLKSLSVLLGLFFIFVGVIKISSIVSKELHKDLVSIQLIILIIPLFYNSKIFVGELPGQRKEYVKYAKVFPFSELLSFKVPSKWYRRTVGVLEIVFGAALAFYPNHKVKNGANMGLLMLTVMAMYSHYMVADQMERTAPAIVFFFLLCGRLVVFFQLKKQRDLMQEQAQPVSNGFKQE